LDSDFLSPQSTPEGFRAEGWDGMLHLHAVEKVNNILQRCGTVPPSTLLTCQWPSQMWNKLPWDADGTVSQWTPAIGVFALIGLPPEFPVAHVIIGIQHDV
jgi:hypothetical protein